MIFLDVESDTDAKTLNSVCCRVVVVLPISIFIDSFAYIVLYHCKTFYVVQKIYVSQQRNISN